MVKKEYKYSKLTKKIIGIILIFLCLILAFICINKFKNFWGIFISFNFIILTETLVKVFLPNKITKQEQNTNTAPPQPKSKPQKSRRRRGLFGRRRKWF